MTDLILGADTRLEAAFGASPETDPTTWTWTDLTPLLLSQSLQVRYGRQNEMSQGQPTRVSFVLDNADGRFTPDDPRSPHWPDIVVGVPLRITVAGHIRFHGEAASWEPTWPQGDLESLDTAESLMRVEAAGIGRRLGQGEPPLESPLRRHYLAYGTQLVGYVPLEEPRSDRNRTAGNLTPDARPVRYGTGPAPDYPRLPVWVGDDTCPGSAPLPTFPVLEYFGWSLGAGTAEHTSPWQVYVSIRVPPGCPQAWLCEWKTDGTLRHWELLLDSNARLEVHAFDDDEDSPREETWTSTAAPVDDGMWRTVAVTAVETSSGGTVLFIHVHSEDEQFSTVSNLAAGQVTNLRPRPLFVTVGDPAPEPIGLGHMAVLGSPPGDVVAVPADPGPADGWAGERAASRIGRLGREHGITVRLPGLEADRDTFTRTVADGWGFTEAQDAYWDLVSGHDTIPTEFSVDGTAGVMLFGEESVGIATDPTPEPVDIDLTVCVEMLGDDALTDRGVEFRDGNYQVSLFQPFDQLVVWRFDGSSFSDVAVRQFTVGYLDIGPIWLRVQAHGNQIRARVWRDGQPEPGQWHITYIDDDPWLDVSNVAVFGAQLQDDPATLRWLFFELRHFDESQRVGVQQPGTLTAVAEQAADVDHGIFAESINEPGWLYRPLHTMYNQDPMLVLDAGNSEIVNPFTPVLDDQTIRNDIEADSNDGAVARVVDRAHIARHGRRPDSPRFNAHTPAQLLSLAGWRLHRGTWPGMRYPAVSPALDAHPELFGRWVRLQLGDRVDIVNLPVQHPLGAVSILNQGWAETISPVGVQARINAAPYGPHEIAQVAAADGSQDARGQAADSDHSQLGDDINDGQETFDVLTDANHPLRGLWTTDSDDWDTSSVATKGIIVAWPGPESSIPAGWRRVTELDGRYPKGAPSPASSVGRAGGQATHSHTAGGHTHSLNHSHTTPSAIGGTSNSTKRQSGGGDDAFSTGHSHSWPTTGTTAVNSASTNPPVGEVPNDPAHVEVIWIEARETATGVPDDAVTFSAAESAPADWTRVYSGRFLKGAPVDGDGGTTQAGDTSHQHPIGAHTHFGASHTHTSANSGTSSATVGLAAGTIGTLESTHRHAIDINAASTASLHSATGGDSNAADAALPPFTWVSALRNDTGSAAAVPAGTIAAWMGTADDIPEGWALCDGTNDTPDLMGRYPRAADNADQHGETGGSLAGHTHTTSSHSHSTSGHSHTASTTSPTGFNILVGRGSGSQNVAHHQHTHNIGSTHQATPTVGSSTSGTLATAESEPEHTTVWWIMAVVDDADLTLVVDGPPRHGGPLLINIGGEHMQISDISAAADPTIQDTTTTSWFTDAGHTISAPSGDLEGRLLILMVVTDSGAITGDPTGGETWQPLMRQDGINGSTAGAAWWWKLGGDSEPGSYGVGGITNSAAAILVAVSDAATPLKADSTMQVGAHSTVGTPSVRLFVDGLDLRWLARIPDTGTPTPPSGWSMAANIGGPGMRAAVAARTVGEGATGAETWSASGTSTGNAGGTTAIPTTGRQTFTVARSVNGIRKPHTAGTPVHVAYPARIGL